MEENSSHIAEYINSFKSYEFLFGHDVRVQFDKVRGLFHKPFISLRLSF